MMLLLVKFRSSDDTWISLGIDMDTRISRTESLAILTCRQAYTLPVFNGWILARLGHRSHSPRNAVLLYSSLKADICRRAVTRYRGFSFWRVVTRVHAHIVRMCVIRAGRYQCCTCGTPRRRLMHFYGG